MWNRQREAEAAREKLAAIGDEPVAPNRNPPHVEQAEPANDVSRTPIEPADAAE
jgi:ATP-binding cassette subfamily B protein